MATEEQEQKILNTVKEIREKILTGEPSYTSRAVLPVRALSNEAGGKFDRGTVRAAMLRLVKEGFLEERLGPNQMTQFVVRSYEIDEVKTMLSVRYTWDTFIAFTILDNPNAKWDPDEFHALAAQMRDMILAYRDEFRSREKALAERKKKLERLKRRQKPGAQPNTEKGASLEIASLGADEPLREAEQRAYDEQAQQLELDKRRKRLPFVEGDVRYHTRMAEMAGLQFLEPILNIVHHFPDMYFVQQFPSLKTDHIVEAFRQVLEEHERIVATIDAGWNAVKHAESDAGRQQVRVLHATQIKEAVRNHVQGTLKWGFEGRGGVKGIKLEDVDHLETDFRTVEPRRPDSIGNDGKTPPVTKVTAVELGSNAIQVYPNQELAIAEVCRRLEGKNLPEAVVLGSNLGYTIEQIVKKLIDSNAVQRVKLIYGCPAEAIRLEVQHQAYRMRPVTEKATSWDANGLQRIKHNLPQSLKGLLVDNELLVLSWYCWFPTFVDCKAEERSRLKKIAKELKVGLTRPPDETTDRLTVNGHDMPHLIVDSRCSDYVLLTRVFQLHVKAVEEYFALKKDHPDWDEMEDLQSETKVEHRLDPRDFFWDWIGKPVPEQTKPK